MPADRLRGITAPTLVLNGDANDAHLQTAAEAVAAVIPGAPLSRARTTVCCTTHTHSSLRWCPASP
jgi:hypothetical protein